MGIEPTIPPWQGGVLPLNYTRSYMYAAKLERVMGIEPTLSAWKAEVLPLNYTRFFNSAF